MIIDLTNLFKNEEENLEINVNIDDFKVKTAFGSIEFDTPLNIRGTIKNHLGMVMLNYNISGKYKVPCDRCNEITEFIFNKSIEHELVREESDNMDFETLFIENNILDLNETVENDIILNIRSKHLCSEDCKGLCIKCGTNLNKKSCNCDKKDVDPRLSKLMDFFEEK